MRQSSNDVCRRREDGVYIDIIWSCDGKWVLVSHNCLSRYGRFKTRRLAKKAASRLGLWPKGSTGSKPSD